jgi:RNA polymerase sigma-70 factor (TIGR02943 family)
MNRETLDPSLWIEKYSDEMFRFTLLRVKEETHVDDIIQETILAALQAKGSFEGRSTEKTWLFGILKNKIFEYYRETKKKYKYALELKDEANPCDSEFDGKGHWQALPFSWGIDPDKAFENKQNYQVLSECIDGLSPKYRQLFVFREIEKQSAESICKDFDITTNNLWVILHRVRNLLKKCIESHLPEIK